MSPPSHEQYSPNYTALYPIYLFPLAIILHKRVLAAQLLKHLLCVLLGAVFGVGVGDGGLYFR